VKIFISYARNDSVDLAKRIQKNLDTYHHTVFLDTETLNPGQEWEGEIDEFIDNCDIFLVIVTYASLKSLQVKREFELARKMNKIIIPCFHEAVKEKDIQLELRKTNGITFNNGYELARDVTAKINLFEQPNQSGSELKPQAVINYIDVNHNVNHNSINGMNIKINIKTKNFKGKAGKVFVSFYFANNTPLKGYNQHTGKLEGQLWIGRDLNTQNGDIIYRDAVLFMPYYGLYLQTGIIHNLFMIVSIWDISRNDPILVASALGPHFQIKG